MTMFSYVIRLLNAIEYLDEIHVGPIKRNRPNDELSLLSEI